MNYGDIAVTDDPVEVKQTCFLYQNKILLFSITLYESILFKYMICFFIFIQAGYDNVNSTDYFVIPGSNDGSFISNLKNSSNVNFPGRWAFRVDSGHHTSKSKKSCILEIDNKEGFFFLINNIYNPM